MGKAKQPDKLKALKTGATRAQSGKKASKKATGRKPSKQTPAPPTVHLLTDTQIEQVAGIPDESQMDQVADDLSPEDREAFARLRQLLAEHLGSQAAARLWLVSPGTGFETTALDAVRKGQAKVVLGTLETQWGPSPTYA